MSVINRIKLLFLIVGFSTLFLSTSHAANVELLKEPLTQPLSTSPWYLEFGPRYWYSSARYQERLFGGDSADMVSRLTYEDLSTNAAEAFWKLAHQNGVYLKGYVGGGNIDDGQLIDEDFPPGVTPYSRTASPQKNGNLGYLSIDLGYDLFKALTWRLGGFIGYHYWHEQVNNFGCLQTANGPICTSPIAFSVDTLNNSASWNSLRLGGNGEVDLGQSWRLEADLAYIHSTLSENDFHNLRPTIRGLLDTGKGDGFQLDVILKWLFTDNLTLGAGGRWWYLATDGWAHFEQTAASGQPQPLDGTQSRYGLLLQASYQFLDRPNLSKDGDLTSDFNWQGAYLGGNIGYGTEPSMVYFSPSSETAQLLQANSLAPISLNIQNAGFLAGGQLGYNWQLRQFILGVEGDIDYAQIGGANAATSELPLTTTVNQNIRWLSSIRARVGKLASQQMLVYLTAGPGWGGVTLATDQRDPALPCAANPVCFATTQNSSKSGWVAGGGVEYAVTPRITFKAEYLYVDLGSLHVNASDGQTSYLVSSRFNENTLRLGVNYKFY